MQKDTSTALKPAAGWFSDTFFASKSRADQLLQRANSLTAQLRPAQARLQNASCS